jgi:hypothetical protein
MKLATPASPHLNPLIKQLAIRLGWQKTPPKSLVIPQAGEEANESLREFFTTR